MLGQFLRSRFWRVRNVFVLLFLKENIFVLLALVLKKWLRWHCLARWCSSTQWSLWPFQWDLGYFYFLRVSNHWAILGILIVLWLCGWQRWVVNLWLLFPHIHILSAHWILLWIQLRAYFLRLLVAHSRSVGSESWQRLEGNQICITEGAFYLKAIPCNLAIDVELALANEILNFSFLLVNHLFEVAHFKTIFFTFNFLLMLQSSYLLL